MKFKESEDQHYQTAQSRVPKSTFRMLKALADQKGTTVSRLISIAIDNELEAQYPFNYPFEVPVTPADEDSYIDEAGKIYRYLQKIPNGISKEGLLLIRRDVGISDKDIFMKGYRKLVDGNWIKEFESKPMWGVPKQIKIKLREEKADK